MTLIACLLAAFFYMTAGAFFVGVLWVADALFEHLGDTDPLFDYDDHPRLFGVLLALAWPFLAWMLFAIVTSPEKEDSP